MTNNLDITNVFVENQLFIKPDYKMDAFVSGNKYRKLKYNIIEAKKQGFHTLLTFGGAYSNHIAAVAKAGQAKGFKTIGVIRGEELQNSIQNNPTLQFASEMGMQLEFVTRGQYREKQSESFLEQIKQKFGHVYIIPEGGTNALAVKGCEEILTESDRQFDFICCPVGTGGTLSGLVNASSKHQKILGFPALKGDFLTKDICKFAQGKNWELITDYHFGGYAKINQDLISFINAFKQKHQIPLDPIYTGKMLFGLVDMLKKEYFPEGSKILAVHTGGLQGIAGMNNKLKLKNMPLIQYP